MQTQEKKSEVSKFFQTHTELFDASSYIRSKIPKNFSQVIVQHDAMSIKPYIFKEND